MGPGFRLLAFVAAFRSACSARTRGQSMIQQQVQRSRKEQSAYLPTEIRRMYINVNGVQYSRKGAEGATLGRVCHLGLLGLPPSVHFVAPGPKAWTKANTRVSLIANITSAQESQLGVSASVAVANVKATGSFGMNSTHKAGMTIQKLAFNDRWKILKYFNKPTKSDFARRYRELYMPRIVLAIWVLVDQQVPEIGSSCVGGSLTLEYMGQGGKISGSGCGDSSWTFNTGAVVAYRLGKVVFDRQGKAIRIDEDSGTR